MAKYIKLDTIKAQLEDLVGWCQDLRKPGLEQALAMLNEEPIAETVSLHDIYRVIAGHSYYHGDAILAALSCIVEGKEVNPVRPVDVAPVVRCKDCIHYDMGVCLKIYSAGNAHPEAWQPRRPEDFCSYGGRKDDEHEH